MAERDPNLPQSADPELQADLVRLLQVQGPLGMLNVIDAVLPVVIMGQVVTQVVNVRQPAFLSTEVFSSRLIAPAINTVHADTGPLPVGTYDIQAGFQIENNGTSLLFEFQHRNAANAANLAAWPVGVVNGAPNNVPNQQSFPLSFGYEIGVNERFRFQNLGAAGSAGSDWSNWIMAVRRA